MSQDLKDKKFVLNSEYDNRLRKTSLKTSNVRNEILHILNQYQDHYIAGDE